MNPASPYPTDEFSALLARHSEGSQAHAVVTTFQALQRAERPALAVFAPDSLQPGRVLARICQMGLDSARPLDGWDSLKDRLHVRLSRAGTAEFFHPFAETASSRYAGFEALDMYFASEKTWGADLAAFVHGAAFLFDADAGPTESFWQFAEEMSRYGVPVWFAGLNAENRYAAAAALDREAERLLAQSSGWLRAPGLCFVLNEGRNTPQALAGARWPVLSVAEWVTQAVLPALSGEWEDRMPFRSRLLREWLSQLPVEEAPPAQAAAPTESAPADDYAAELDYAQGLSAVRETGFSEQPAAFEERLPTVREDYENDTEAQDAFGAPPAPQSLHDSFLPGPETAGAWDRTAERGGLETASAFPTEPPRESEATETAFARAEMEPVASYESETAPAALYARTERDGDENAQRPTEPIAAADLYAEPVAEEAAPTPAALSEAFPVAESADDAEETAAWGALTVDEMLALIPVNEEEAQEEETPTPFAYDETETAETADFDFDYETPPLTASFSEVGFASGLVAEETRWEDDADSEERESEFDPADGPCFTPLTVGEATPERPVPERPVLVSYEEPEETPTAAFAEPIAESTLAAFAAEEEIEETPFVAPIAEQTAHEFVAQEPLPETEEAPFAAPVAAFSTEEATAEAEIAEIAAASVESENPVVLTTAQTWEAAETVAAVSSVTETVAESITEPVGSAERYAEEPVQATTAVSAFEEPVATTVASAFTEDTQPAEPIRAQNDSTEYETRSEETDPAPVERASPGLRAVVYNPLSELYTALDNFEGALKRHIAVWRTQAQSETEPFAWTTFSEALETCLNAPEGPVSPVADWFESQGAQVTAQDFLPDAAFWRTAGPEAGSDDSEIACALSFAAPGLMVARRSPALGFVTAAAGAFVGFGVGLSRRQQGEEESRALIQQRLTLLEAGLAHIVFKRALEQAAHLTMDEDAERRAA